MATVVSGRRQYNNNSSRIVTNVFPKIILVDEDINSAGFMSFFSKVPVQNTVTEKFQWDVDTFLPLSDTQNDASFTTGGSAGDSETVTMSNGVRWNPGDLWLNKRTGEVIYVSSVSGNDVTMIRAVTEQNSEGGTAYTDFVNGDTFIRLGPAVAETSSRQTTLHTTPAQVYNYTQMFRWDLSVSRRQIKRAFDTGNELPYLQMKQLKEARKQINGTLIDGERGRWTQTTDLTTTQGIRSAVSTYTYSVGGTLHEYDFDEFLVEEALRKGSRNKVMFASTQVILAITQIAKDRLQMGTVSFGPKKGTFGMQVLRYLAPNGGEILIVEDRYLSENRNGEAIFCDMSQLKRRVFSRNGFNDDLHIIEGTQNVDDVGKVVTLYGDFGLQYGAEECHATMTGVTGGALGRATL